MGFGVKIEGAPFLLEFGASVENRMASLANDNGASNGGQNVTVRKLLDKSGIEIKIKVPVEDYIGVAVSTSITEEGALSSVIELVHADPDLNHQVFEEAGNTNVVAEWQAWGRKLRLPLFIKAGDGSLMPYTQQVDGVMVGETTERRKLSAQASRRPRFLNRRKPGQPANS